MKPAEGRPRKVIPITPAAPAIQQPELVSLYEAQKKIYPRSISGLFARWRWAMVFLTQLVFYGLPWLQWGERQMVLFDLGTRRFYMFGLVLYPQDFIYLTGLLIISALSLFLFTAVAGRLWCGFTCPQTVYTEIFMWIEHKIEGDRSTRIRLDNGSWTFEKIWKKSLKQFAWVSVALWTGFTFVGYFVPIRELGGELLSLHGSWQIFWVLFYGLATYGNAGYLREQVCKYMCPYARFHSAMFDNDTLVVTYDPERGEPRGPRGKRADPAALGLGSCVDCQLCVHVCPTGIDIRKGLQYECIGCAACIDACDNVMDRMGYARGLIRYDTQNGLAQHLARGQRLRRIFRPRVLVYGSVLVAIVAALFVTLALRAPFRVDVVRDRVALARQVGDGEIENVYRLQVMNATESPQRLRIAAEGLPAIRLEGQAELALAPAEAQWVTVAARIPPQTAASAGAGVHPIRFVVAQVGAGGQAGASVSEKSTFVVPR